MNPILKEIRETRDRMAEEAGYDLKRLFEMAREYEQAAKDRGESVIPEPARASALREEPK